MTRPWLILCPISPLNPIRITGLSVTHVKKQSSLLDKTAKKLNCSSHKGSSRQKKKKRHVERPKQISLLPGCPPGTNLSLFFLRVGSEPRDSHPAKSWGPPAPQFPLPSQLPGASGKGGIEGSFEEVKHESSQKIMACLLNSRA